MMRSLSRILLIALGALVIAAIGRDPASADTLTLYAAGSLHEA